MMSTQQKQIPQKKRGGGRFWLILTAVLLTIVLIAIVAVLLLPGLLVKQATQKPSEAVTGTFVTRQAETSTTSLQDRLQQSLSGGQVNVTQGGNTSSGSQTGQTDSSGQSVSVDQSFNNQTSGNVNQGQSSQSGQSGQTSQSGQSGAVNQSASQTAAQPGNDGTVQNPPAGNEVPNNPPANQAPSDGRFRVSLAESEISSMIYSGLSQGTAPEYRASIQGVSTRIAGGRARITVALLPQHLPDAFLKNLPGVTRQTPTVYLGGEMGLRREGDSVVPDIYELSLGNFRVPMPFIQQAVKATVQQQAAQMLRMPNGQQARLDEVILDGGALTLVGHVE